MKSICIIMKRIVIFFTLIIGLLSYGQNTETETITTKKTITDNKGSRTETENKSFTKSQKMRLDEEDVNKVNQSVIIEPEEINTEVSYDFEGSQFQFSDRKNNEGYRFSEINGKSKDNHALITPSSKRGYYIITKDDKTSMGYFNKDGNFVIEHFDKEKEKIVQEIYKLTKQPSNKNK